MEQEPTTSEKATNKRRAIQRRKNRALGKLHRQETARKNYLARCARRRSRKH